MSIIKSPIFIGGSGRSGTSLLFKLIAREDCCYSFNFLETKFIIGVDSLLDLYNSISCDYSTGRAKLAIGRFRKTMNRLKTGGVYKDVGFETLYKESNQYDKIVKRFLLSLQHPNEVAKYLSDQQAIQLFRNFLVDMISNLSVYSENKRFVEKTPHNILHLNFLFNLFPDMKFVHIIRDPRGVAFSLSKQTWGPSNFEDACYWLCHVYDAFLSQANFQSLTSPANFMQVKLEDLAGDQLKKTNRKLRSFLNMETFNLKPDEINEGQINYWQNEITKEQMIKANFVLGKYIAHFNYGM